MCLLAVTVNLASMHFQKGVKERGNLLLSNDSMG